MKVSFLVFNIGLLLSLEEVGGSRVGIVGGREAEPHSRPYLASLQTRATHECGGALVREDFVLTAAHCSRRFRVVLGAHSLGARESSKQKLEVQSYIRHPGFQVVGDDTDLMLLKLASRARLTREVRLIPLMKNPPSPGSQCSTAGWGDVGDNRTLADRLQEVDVRILSPSECARRWNLPITDKMLCGTGQQAFQGFCSGDSGGPLVCSGELAGLVSFSGKKCANPSTPDVYMRVSANLPWIQEVIDKG
ncbi:serine protease 57-like [Hypomesus transpacificus]|uniref:serine protease 57-like n=1 Tax=Hypomesus transpacificus TaxID=137520 RepID=UPI001F07EADE|nr:serine protease 57-like [Hypomesus transpacificus]